MGLKMNDLNVCMERNAQSSGFMPIICLTNHGSRSVRIQLNENYMEYLLSEDQAIYMNFLDWMYKDLAEETSSVI